MSYQAGRGLETTIGLEVGDNEPISLRLCRDGSAYLTISHGVEIVLARTHVATLREQSAAVLADMLTLGAADEKTSEASSLSEQVTSIAEYARAKAAAALAAGADEEARDARVAADRAAEAVALVGTAVQATWEALWAAEDAGEAAGEAGAVAANAAAALSHPTP